MERALGATCRGRHRAVSFKVKAIRKLKKNIFFIDEVEDEMNFLNTRGLKR